MALVKENGVWRLVNNGNPVAREWREIYRVNFKTIAAHDFKSDGDTLVISGSTWSQVNKGNASVLEFDGSTGLKINPANGSNLFSGGDTAPRLMCEVNQLCGGDWNPNLDSVAFILRMTSSTGIQANYDSFGMVMTQDSGAIGSGQNNKFCKSGPLFVTEENYDVSDGTEYDEPYSGVDADCVIMTIYAGGQVRTRGGVFGWGSIPSSKFPIPKSDTDWTTIHSTANWNSTTTRFNDNPGSVDTKLIMSMSKWAVGPFSFEVSSGTGIEALFTEFIVLRLE
tara:strand:- start:1966 stop:2808 length:843 start_codon:yes stop_codon:yes gene_type:complete